MIVVASILGLWTRAAVRRLRRLKGNHAASLTLLNLELDRRYEQIPVLVATSAGAGVDRGDLRPVTGARSLAIEVRDRHMSIPERAVAESTLSTALRALFTAAGDVHHWPFRRSVGDLQLTEQRIAGAAHVHNDLGRTINTAVRRFPASLFARIAGLTAVPLFEVGRAWPAEDAGVLPPAPGASGRRDDSGAGSSDAGSSDAPVVAA